MIEYVSTLVDVAIQIGCITAIALLAEMVYPSKPKKKVPPVALSSRYVNTAHNNTELHNELSLSKKFINGK